VETADGHNLPKNCFIGVRVGDVLKQGRYEPQRCYNFPQLDRRRNAKVDIYQHVGTCMVAVDPDTKATHEVAVSSLDTETPNSRIKIHIQAMSEENKQQREQRTKALKVQARDYLMRYSIEERLSEAVKALLKEQPADPTAFLCKQLTDWDKAQAGDPKSGKQEATAAPAASELPQVFEDESVNRLRKDARNAFIRASDDGTLETALQGAKVGGAKDTKPQPQGKEELRLRVSNLLMSSAENGDLEKALASVMQEGIGSMGKEQYLESLRQEAAGGSEQASYQNADESEIIRMEAQQLLVAAMQNGTLENILSSVTNNKGSEKLETKVTKLFGSVPPEDHRRKTAEVMQGVSAADRKKVMAAIEKIEADDPKDALRIKVAELMLDAPEKDLDGALAKVMKDVSKADKEKIVQAIEKLEGGKDSLRIQLAEMIIRVPPEDLQKTVASVMKDLSAADRKKIQDALDKLWAKEERAELRYTVLELLRASPEADLQRNLHTVMQGMTADDRKKIQEAIKHLEAGSGKDALRIKVAELMLAAPPHQAIESTIKDLSAADRQKIWEAIQHIEGASGSQEAMAGMAAELLVSAAEDGKFENKLADAVEAQDTLPLRERIVELLGRSKEDDLSKDLAAVMKDLSAADKKKIQDAVKKVEGDPKHKLRMKIAELMLQMPEGETLEKSLAAVMKDLNAADVMKIREAVAKVEMGAAKLTAKFMALMESSPEDQLGDNLKKVMKELSASDRGKLQEAMAQVEADPNEALRLKVAELLLRASESHLETALAAIMKDLPAAERAKIVSAIDRVEAFHGPIVTQNVMMNSSLNSFGMQPGLAIM